MGQSAEWITFSSRWGAGLHFSIMTTMVGSTYLVLSGTRREGPVAGATNRLYRNNRDGTFADVTKQAGLTRQGWSCGVTIGDYNNDGFDDIFITEWGQNVLYRNNGNGTFTDVTREAGLLAETGVGGRVARGSIITAMASGSVYLALCCVSIFNRIPATGRNPNCNFGGVPVYCGPRGLRTRALPALSQQWRWNVYRREPSRRGSSARRLAYGLTAMAADFFGTRLARHLCRLRFHAEPLVS